MTTSLQSHAIAPRLMPDVAAMQRLDDAGYQLIRLHRFDYRDPFDRERGKSPFHANWRALEYKNAEVLREASEDGYNVGVRLRESDLVIDFDPRNLEPGVTAETALSDLELEFGVNLHACPCVETGGGGRHFYLRRSSTGPIRNGLPQLSKAIEFKSWGRQVVAPGSVHPSGRRYAWALNSPDPRDTPEAPAALLDAIARPLPSARTSEPGELSVEELRECLRQIPVENYRAQHEYWLQLLMACHSGTNGSAEGREEFVAWCVGDPAYADDADDIRYRWESFEPNAPGGITVGTLYHHVIEAGGRPPRPKAAEQFEPLPEVGYAPCFEVDKAGVPIKGSTHNAVEAVKALGLEPRWDTFRGRVLFDGDLSRLRAVYPSATREWDGNSATAIRRVSLDTWRADCADEKFRFAVESESLARCFSSLQEHLDTLPDWDGEYRLDRWLVELCGAEDSEYVRAVGRLTLLAAAARAYVPGIKFDAMLILEGPQGCGKSTLLRTLAGDDFYLDGLPKGDPQDKDVVAGIAGRWIVEATELAIFKTADQDALKAFLSRTVDRARLAYKPLPEDFPRQCVVIGTTNDDDYLRDPTGLRRFWPVKVGPIDLERAAAWRPQLLAEARDTWLEGPQRGAEAEARLMLPEALWAAAAEEQEARREVDPFEPKLAVYFERHPERDEFTTDELLFACGVSAGAQKPADARRLRGIMRRFPAFESERVTVGGKRVRGYRRLPS